MYIYYIYFYLRDDFTPYYVGKGKGYRAYDKNHSIHPPEDKNRIVFIHQELSELQAFILERYYIRWFGRKDNHTGVLRNKTDGGEGTSGFLQTEEHINKRINQYKGKNHWTYGQTHTDEYKTKMSLSLRGKNKEPKSDEHKKKISNTLKGKPIFYKEVICPHCGKIGKENNMYRWHFDRCKHKGEE